MTKPETVDRYYSLTIGPENTDILHPSGLRYNSYYLNPEVSKWCDELFGPHWTYTIKDTYNFHTDKPNFGVIVELFFETEANLTMFSLRWIK